MLLTSSLLLILTVILSLLRLDKIRQFRRLEEIQRHIVEQHQQSVAASKPTFDCLPSFQEKWITIPDFLPSETFQALQEQALTCQLTERSYLPGHKKGGTIAYEKLHSLAPKLVAFYQSAELRALCSRIIGEAVVPTPIHDQSSCSLLFYEKPDDHIGWHYDYNFYHGRHFTALLPIVNQSTEDDRLSSAKLVIKTGGQDIVIPTPPNSLVLFEGAHIYHKVTPLGHQERRILLSMTFCTNPQTSLIKNQIRRIKDTAYFGIRALWT
ncbi:MAG: hypothetical protein V2J55_10595 [Candidatus Competibacteraceae bacterium]|jgi:hypothetical protein|nr:hypothetical protein [Candidatus Competibacteraceae bacterium]